MYIYPDPNALRGIQRHTSYRQQLFHKFQYPEWGMTKMVGFPWDFSKTSASWRREAPAFGQHSEEILSELGYNSGDIANLKEGGVIQ